ncbi:MAG: hypothetical protein ACXWLH_00695 [Candidatus Saccharimonadales bacterium]
MSKLLDSAEQFFGAPMEAMVRRVSEIDPSVDAVANVAMKMDLINPTTANPASEQATFTATHGNQELSTPSTTNPANYSVINVETAKQAVEKSFDVPEMPVPTDAITAPELPETPEFATVPSAPTHVAKVRSEAEITEMSDLQSESYRLIEEALGAVSLEDLEGRFADNDPDRSERNLESV